MGGVLAMCELLRMRPSATMDSSLCPEMFQMLILAEKTDPEALTAACDGLRRTRWNRSTCRRCGHAFFPAKSDRFATFVSDHRLWDEIKLAQSAWHLLGQLAS